MEKLNARPHPRKSPFRNLQSEEKETLYNRLYLEYIVTSNGRWDTKVKRRIAKAKDVFTKLSPVIKKRKEKVETSLWTLK